MKKIVTALMAGLVMTIFAAESFAVEVFGVDIHGFISQGYLSNTENDFTSETDDGTFLFSEVGINFGKEMTENLRFGIQLFARDFGDISNNEITIDWAFADYRFHEMLGLRLGQIKTPHGLYNEVRDIDMLRNPIFLPDSIYQDLSQDLFVNDVVLSFQGISSRYINMSLQGIGVYGYVDMNMAGGLSYQAMYGTQDIDPNDSISDRRFEYFSNAIPGIDVEADTLKNDKIDVDYKYAGNIVYDSFLDGLRLGASLDNMAMTVTSRFTQDLMGQNPLDPSGDEVAWAHAGDIAEVEYRKIENWVYSVEYTWENLILMAEYILTEKEYNIDAFSDWPSDHSTMESSGWYVGGAYRFLDWFELGGYYSASEYDKPESNISIPIYFFSEFNDICLTGRFDINEYWAIKLEAHKFNGVYPIPTTDNLFESNMKDIEEDWYMFAAKMTVAF